MLRISKGYLVVETRTKTCNKKGTFGEGKRERERVRGKREERERKER